MPAAMVKKLNSAKTAKRIAGSGSVRIGKISERKDHQGARSENIGKNRC